MHDLRPDLVFVVSSPVWATYCWLRNVHDPLTKGFHDNCTARIAEAEATGNKRAAFLWQQVALLAELYGPSWASAIEVEGELIREVEKQPVLRYPEDADLTRVVISEAARHPLPPEVIDITLRTPPKRSPDGSLRMVLKKERHESDAGVSSSDLGLTVGTDGEVRIDGCYAGPSAKAIWGDFDHEFWLTIPPDHLPELLGLLLRHACNATAPLNWTRLRQLLEEGEVPHRESSW